MECSEASCCWRLSTSLTQPPGGSGGQQPPPIVHLPQCALLHLIGRSDLARSGGAGHWNRPEEARGFTCLQEDSPPRIRDSGRMNDAERTESQSHPEILGKIRGLCREAAPGTHARAAARPG